VCSSDLKDYEEQHKAGVERYTFNPLKLGIKNATFWEKRYNKQTATTKKKTETETEKEAEMV